VVSAGDIVNGKPGMAVRDDLAYLTCSIIDRLDIPFMPCPGNHENHGHTDADYNRPYDECFGPLWHNYVFTYGGTAFLVVDTSDAHRLPDEVTAKRNDFVRRALERFAHLPVLVGGDEQPSYSACYWPTTAANMPHMP